MSAGAIRAGQAFVEIVARDKTDAGMNSAQRRLLNFSSSIRATAKIVSTALATAVSHLAISSIKEFVAAGRELQTTLSGIKALGPILDSEDIDRAKRLGDSFDALGEAWKRAKQQLGSSLAPFTQQVTTEATGAMVELAKRIEAEGPGFLLNPFAGVTRSSAQASGGQAVAEATKALEAERAKAEAAKVQAAADKAAEESAKRQAQQQNIINKGIEQRQRIIEEFESEHERFLRKEQEIVAAIAQLHRNVLLGFTGNEQMGGLQSALMRLRSQEQTRLAEAMKQNQIEQPEQARAEITRGSRGTFSARGAGMLGFGTAKIITDDVNGKVIVKELVGIRQEIGKAVPVFQ